jgi:hypothetical protein
MKKIAFIVLLVTLMLAAALPVMASSKDPVGTQVYLLAGEDVEVSGPFHVLHGHNLLPGEHNAIGKMDFVLKIDGVEQIGQQVTWKDGDALFHTKLFNYPEGLPSGDHVFTGIWYEPCYLFNDDCEKDNELDDPPFTMEIVVTVP